MIPFLVAFFINVVTCEAAICNRIRVVCSSPSKQGYCSWRIPKTLPWDGKHPEAISGKVASVSVMNEWTAIDNRHLSAMHQHYTSHFAYVSYEADKWWWDGSFIQLFELYWLLVARICSICVVLSCFPISISFWVGNALMARFCALASIHIEFKWSLLVLLLT